MWIDPDRLPPDDFRFRLGTTPGDADQYYALSPEAPAVLAERQHWLTTAPELYSGLRPEGVPLVEELCEIAAGWSAFRDVVPPLRFDPSDPRASLIALGTHLEPDISLMAPDGRGSFTVAAGCVCFPSAWRLTDKLGRSTEMTHGPVPGLNAAIAPSIDKLMTGMRGGRCFVRWNWSICPTTDLNQHPDRPLPSLESPLSLDHIWLRHEHQSLFALPRTGGVLFGIRILHTSWRDLRDSPEAAERMARTLQTMPHDMLVYKRLDVLRDELVRLLDRS